MKNNVYNEKKLMKKIDSLLQEDNTKKEIQQGYDLNDIYYYTFIVNDPINKMKAEAYYIGRYGKVE